MMARARREAINDLDRGDIVSARGRVLGASQALAAACAPYTGDAEIEEQAAMLDQLQAELQEPGNVKASRKKLSYQSYAISRQSKRIK
jgi:hypothetical protein